MVGVLLGRSFDMSAEDSLLFTASVRSCSQPCLIFLGQSAAMLGFVQILACDGSLSKASACYR